MAPVAQSMVAARSAVARPALVSQFQEASGARGARGASGGWDPVCRLPVYLGSLLLVVSLFPPPTEGV